jgi:hypothetical protein
MSSKQLTYVFSILLSIVLLTVILYFLNDRQESPFLKYQLDTSELRVDNSDSDIGKWILPAIMMGEDFDKEFIEENVFISQFQMTVAEEVIRISFSIFYYIDNRLTVKHYQVRDHGLMIVINETGSKGSYEQLLSIVTLNEIFKAVNKDKIKDLFGIEHSISFVEIKSISRLEDVEIEKEKIVVLNNQFIEIGDIPLDRNYAVCFITFAGNGGGSVLPFIISMN